MESLLNFNTPQQDRRDIQINRDNTMSVIDNTRTCENSTEGWNKVTNNKRNSWSKSPVTNVQGQFEKLTTTQSDDEESTKSVTADNSMDIDDEQDAKPSALKDPPGYDRNNKLKPKIYNNSKRWADDSSKSESEDDI